MNLYHNMEETIVFDRKF